MHIFFTKAFSKDLKRIKKQQRNMEKLNSVLEILSKKRELPPKYKDHSLKGHYTGYRECHLEPDWLFVYKIEEDLLTCYRTGSHSDLFG